MGSTIGTALRVTLFGQSHSEAIGCVIEGMPSGFAIDQEVLAAFMARRAPGNTVWSTTRKEADQVRFVGGLNEDGRTCGAPLALIIENTNTRSGDYEQLKRVPRPGHADFTAQAKWHGEQDVRGGGHFSARLTAPLCAAGGIALQVLQTKDIDIAAHAARIADVEDVPFDATDLSPTSLATLAIEIERLHDGRAFPVIDEEAGKSMQKRIEEARRNLDSVGGVIEAVCCGLPAGIGEPIFDGIESTFARMAFGIPAIKGLEFGVGFAASTSTGSKNNDAYRMSHEKVVLSSNNAGGNLGGITTGAPLIARLGIKPTPSIAQEQQSVDLISGKDATLKVQGRHDPCVVPRAVPVVEAALALSILDSWLAWPPAGESFVL